MNKSLGSLSVSNVNLIDLDESDKKSAFSHRPVTIVSTLQSKNLLGSFQNTQSLPKLGSQIASNSNFYMTMPNSMPLNLSQSQAQSGVGLGIPYSTYLSKGSRVIGPTDTRSIPESNKSNQQDEKLPRIRRTNIPQTTIINTKTRQVIDNVMLGRGEAGLQHAEDKEIVQRLNRLLIEGEWGYSSLFGKQNRRLGDYPGEKNPRDLDFPSVMGLVSPQMKENFKKNGVDFVNLVECPHKVKLVYETMTFGITPNNSRYFVFGLFTLSKNLDPVLLAIGFAKDQVMENQKDDAYYTLMKAFIESNNEELTEERRQFAARKKLLGRRIREPEVISDKSYVFPQIIFCKTDREMTNACDKIKNQYGVSFETHHSFMQRFEALRAKFQRHQIKKDKNIMERGEKVIKKMLQSSNPHDIASGIAELSTYNQEYHSRFKRFGLDKHCLQNLQKRFVGFHIFERFEQPMINYLSTLILQRNGNLLKNFLENIMRRQQMELKAPLPTYQDRYQLLKYNSRIRKLMNVIQPKVLVEYLQMFRIGKSLKQQKDETALIPTYIVGLGKRHSKMKVQFKHDLWKCECGYQAKVGIPCPHLMRVLHVERKTQFKDYINPRFYKLTFSGEQIQIEDS